MAASVLCTMYSVLCIVNYSQGGELGPAPSLNLRRQVLGTIRQKLNEIGECIGLIWIATIKITRKCYCSFNWRAIRAQRDACVCKLVCPGIYFPRFASWCAQAYFFQGLQFGVPLYKFYRVWKLVCSSLHFTGFPSWCAPAYISGVMAIWCAPALIFRGLQFGVPQY